MYTDAQKNWLKRYFDTMTEAELATQFQLQFGEAKNPRTLGTYCRNCLGIVRDNPRGYTDAEISWLRANYPILGRAECAKQFSALFGRGKSAKTLEKYCHKRLGIRCTEERISERYEDSRMPIGTVSRNCRGEYRIKTANGWELLTHHLLDVPNGYVAIHLDKDSDNNDIENLVVVKNGIQTIVNNSDMWSENTNIARTAFKWAELYSLLGNYNQNLDDDMNNFFC